MWGYVQYRWQIRSVNTRGRHRSFAATVNCTNAS